MRTLALLAGLLLLALHGQAGPLAGTADPVMELEDQLPTQAQAAAQDQDMSISFDGNGAFARAAAGSGQRAICYCRSCSCYSWERISGTCTHNGRKYLFCCR